MSNDLPRSIDDKTQRAMHIARCNQRPLNERAPAHVRLAIPPRKTRKRPPFDLSRTARSDNVQGVSMPWRKVTGTSLHAPLGVTRWASLRGRRRRWLPTWCWTLTSTSGFDWRRLGSTAPPSPGSSVRRCIRPTELRGIPWSTSAVGVVGETEAHCWWRACPGCFREPPCC